MNKREAVVVTAYTGIGMSKFDDFHEYVEEIMGRPVWTHELARKEVWEELKELSKAEFLEICAGVSE